MDNKTKVLVFIDWFYPAFKAGGPIKSIFNITQSLKGKLDILIITSNCDVDGTILNVGVNKLINRNTYEIIYLDSNHQNAAQYKKLINHFNPKIVYLNSLFSVKFTLLPYFLTKNSKSIECILAPRGMLGKGALSIKPFKKKLFIWVTRNFLFKKQLVWHASTENELREIEVNYGLKYKIRIAQNISGAINERSRNSIIKEKGQLKLVFLSRISSKKNLIFLLNIISKLKDLKGIKLSIYGPVENDLDWSAHLDIINNDERIEYKGLVAPDQIASTLQDNHLYVLPSLNENYGHSIVESILSGVPILISDQTPWRELAQEDIGYDISLNDISKWKAVIQFYYKMDNESYKKSITSCYVYAKRNIVNEKIMDANISLFQEIRRT